MHHADPTELIRSQKVSLSYLLALHWSITTTNEHNAMERHATLQSLYNCCQYLISNAPFRCGNALRYALFEYSCRDPMLRMVIVVLQLNN